MAVIARGFRAVGGRGPLSWGWRGDRRSGLEEHPDRERKPERGEGGGRAPPPGGECGARPRLSAAEGLAGPALGELGQGGEVVLLFDPPCLGLDGAFQEAPQGLPVPVGGDIVGTLDEPDVGLRMRGTNGLDQRLEDRVDRGTPRRSQPS